MSTQKLNRIFKHRTQVLEQQLDRSRQKALTRRHAVENTQQEIIAAKAALELLRQQHTVGKPSSPQTFIDARHQEDALKQNIRSITSLNAFLEAELRQALKTCQKQAQECMRIKKKREKVMEIQSVEDKKVQYRKDVAAADDYTLYIHAHNSSVRP